MLQIHTLSAGLVDVDLWCTSDLGLVGKNVSAWNSPKDVITFLDAHDAL